MFNSFRTTNASPGFPVGGGEEGLETIKHVDKRLYRLTFGRMFDCHKNKDGMMNVVLNIQKTPLNYV